jgi:outer membrane lipoprotein-sorting protein
LKKIIIFTFYFLILVFLNFTANASLENQLIKKFTSANTLSFNFIQKISEKEEVGKCFIKYPLRMKCDYNNLKQKSIIVNGKTVAIIKKKYKRIYLYPLKITPLYTILQKNTILNIMKTQKPIINNLNLIVYETSDKDNNKLKIFFDKKSLDLKGWETRDIYSNKVNFTVLNLEINKIIDDNFFKIPKESEL